MADKTDITLIQPRENLLKDQATEEILNIMLDADEKDNVIFGRMGLGGLDESDFDNLPREERDLTPEDVETSDLFAGTEDEPAEPFSSPIDHFPVYKQALQHFQAAEAPVRVVRIDTDETYNDFVGERAIKELARRLTELRTFVESHVSDQHGHPVAPMSEWKEVIGAAEAVNSLRAASTTDEATAALPQVPLDLPDFAQGKVKCWLDGDDVVVSLRFCAADGTPRMATMAARPRVDAEEITGWAQRAGVNPVTVLGILPDLAAAATGKRLVRDIAGAALQAQRRLDVVGMTDDGEDAEPVLLTNGGDESTAPLAALMYVEQLADAGHEQAQHEMNIIRAAAETPTGREIAAPILEESTKRLAQGREAKKKAEVLGGHWE